MFAENAKGAKRRKFHLRRRVTAVLHEVLTQVGSQFDNNRRLAAAGRTCFEENPVRNFARPAEFLPVRKSVIAAKSTDGLAFFLNKRQRRMPAHGITKRLQFPVNRVLSQWRLKCFGIEEDVDVFGETLDQVPSLRKARAPFEDNFVSARSSDNAKRLGHVIVFLDDRRTEFALMEVFAGSEDRLLEVGMLKQSQS